MRPIRRSLEKPSTNRYYRQTNANLFPSIFSDLFDTDRFFAGLSGRDTDSWLPAVNIRENEKGYEIDLAVPGLNKEDIKMEIEDHTLIVSAEKEKKKEEEKKDYLRREYKYDAFSRSFSLPDNADEDNIESSYRDGILKVVVAKKAAAPQSSKKVLTVK